MRHAALPEVRAEPVKWSDEAATTAYETPQELVENEEEKTQAVASIMRSMSWVRAASGPSTRARTETTKNAAAVAALSLRG